jgi:hypothetical protein
VDSGAPLYRPESLSTFGRVAGTVEFDGDPPLDTVVTPMSDAEVCGSTVLDGGVTHDGPRLAEAVVWLSGAGHGKPLPVVRRYDVVQAGCALIPRVQAAVAGGTLNVLSDDPVPHRTRLLRPESGELLALVDETGAGQVVPIERVLGRAGIVELRCDQHPWSRAWIAVFAHPYFAVTAADGLFRLDSVPPGRYAIRAWHPRFGSVADSVTVSEGGVVSVVLRLPAFRPR